MKLSVHKALMLAGLLAGVGEAHAVDLQSLVDRSPFSPASSGPGGEGAAEPQGTWEFRGVATDAEGTAYSLFDPSTNKGRWLRAEDVDGPVQIKGFDPANNILEIEQDGRAVRLALKRAVIQAGQPVAAMVPPAPVANPGNRAVPGRRNNVFSQGRSQGQAQAQAAKPDAAVQQQRLQAIAEAARKRREERQALAAKAGQAAPVLVAPAQTTH